MSSIESLTSKINEISTSLAIWNKAVILLIALTAIVAAAYFVVSYYAQKKTTFLDKTKDELIRAKDEEQVLQIAKVRADAETSIATVKAGAEKEIVFINAEIIKAKQEIALANERTELVRLERMRLEEQLAPRVIEQKQSAKELETFSDMSVIIESLAESEPWRVAGQIAWLLSKAKWNVLPGMKRFLDNTPFFDGITVETNVGRRPQEDRSMEVAEALIAILTKNGIVTHRMASKGDLPLNTIKIRVGLKSAEYFEKNRKDLEYGNVLYK